MKAKPLFGILCALTAGLALCQCKNTTPEQKRAIAFKVEEDVLADIAAGAPVLLTTGNGTAAALAVATQEVKNLPGLQATVKQVLETQPATLSPLAPATP